MTNETESSGAVEAEAAERASVRIGGRYWRAREGLKGWTPDMVCIKGWKPRAGAASGGRAEIGSAGTFGVLPDVWYDCCDSGGVMPEDESDSDTIWVQGRIRN